MIDSLAMLYFPDDEEPELQYAEKLFRIKQYYFQKTPIPKVVQQKIGELRVIQDAYTMRFPNIVVESDSMVLDSAQYMGIFGYDYLLLHSVRATIRSHFSRAQNALELVELLDFWYREEYRFANAFSFVFAANDLSHVNLSNSIDPMEILKVLKETNFDLHISQNQLPKEIPKLIVSELLRCAKFIHLHRVCSENQK
jgi:hypothetical protein